MPRLLSFNELRQHGVIYGRRWVDQLEAAGRFPKRVKIGERRVGWIEKEIEQHVQDRIGRKRPSLAPKKKRKAG